jgi:hypothetical protein
MKNTTKIMIAAVLAIFVVVWAAPSEARQRHSRSGKKRQLTSGRSFPNYSNTHVRYHLQHRHRLNHRVHGLKSHQPRRHLHRRYLKPRYTRGNRFRYTRPHHLRKRQRSTIGIHHSPHGTCFHIGVRY